MTPGDSTGSAMDRREFTRRAVCAGAGVAVASWLGLRFHRESPEATTGAASPDFTFGDYRTQGTEGRTSVVTGGDRAGAVQRALELIGGMQAFVRPGERVLIKVNAAFATPPIVGATTHPDALTAVIAACRAAGAREVLVTDNPINDPAMCFRLTGIAAAAERAGARVVVPATRMFRPFTLAGSTLLNQWPVLAAPLEGIDRVIGLAPVKDHHRSGASMSLKNWYGLLGGRRNVFHQDVHALISDLAAMVRPTLVILDGTETMMRNGPTGGSTEDLKPTRTVVVSSDPVAADALGVTLLDRRAEDLAYLVQAAARGAGRLDVDRMDVKRAALA